MMILLAVPDPVLSELLALVIESQFAVKVRQADSVFEVTTKNLAVAPSLIIYDADAEPCADPELAQKAASLLDAIPSIQLRSSPATPARERSENSFSLLKPAITKPLVEILSGFFSRYSHRAEGKPAPTFKIRRKTLALLREPLGPPPKGDTDVVELDYSHLPWLIEEITRRLSAPISGQAAPPSVFGAFQLSTAAHELLSRLCTQLQLRDEALRLARACVETAVRIATTERRLIEYTSVLSRDPENYIAEHSVILGFIAAALFRQVRLKKLGPDERESGGRCLALAAMLHDLALDDPGLAKLKSPDEIFTKNLPYSHDAVARVMRHPLDAANIADLVFEKSPELPIIVAQHHELPDGSGFPGKKTAKDLSALASTLILAHAVVDYAYDTGEAFSSDEFLKLWQERFPPSHFFARLLEGLARLG